jgi:hypothetical protein
MSLILVLYSLKAKKIYFNELTGLIKENDLLFANAEEIRRIFIGVGREVHATMGNCEGTLWRVRKWRMLP